MALIKPPAFNVPNGIIQVAMMLASLGGQVKFETTTTEQVDYSLATAQKFRLKINLSENKMPAE